MGLHGWCYDPPWRYDVGDVAEARGKSFQALDVVARCTHTEQALPFLSHALKQARHDPVHLPPHVARKAVDDALD